MPPRYSYWTIIAGGLPTAFRAADRDELRPTFERIRQRHPDAVMKWFARGKLWASPEAAKSEMERPARGREWRPGGAHRDPRQPFKDAKKARNQDQRRQRFEHKQAGSHRSFKRKPVWRNQETEEPREPPRPPEPTREPRPDETPAPTPPPQPHDPVIRPPGPPERGSRKRPRPPRHRRPRS